MRKPNKHKFRVKKTDENSRIDLFIRKHLPEYSRNFIQKLIENGSIKVNHLDVKPSFRISENDLIDIYLPEKVESDIIPQNIPIEVIYQDEDLIVVNKPAGMVVHPGAGVREGTLVNALLYHIDHLSTVGARLRPGIVHRLDKNTSGLMVIAKNDRSHHELVKQLADKKIDRRYTAIVWHPFLEMENTIETYLNRSKRDRKLFSVAPAGKKAITHFRVRKNFKFSALVDISLETGRTHQIRIHMNHIHHPIFGDPDYHGRNKQLKQMNNQEDRKQAVYLLSQIERQALHACRLSFLHPVEGKKMCFESNPPPDFQNILNLIDDENIA